MASTVTDADRGCRGILLWLAIIAATFAVCVAVGIGIFALNIREYGGDAVRDDLFSLIDTAEMPDGEKIALRVRVDNLVKAFQAEQMTQDDFLEQAIALREDLLTKQPPPPGLPPEAPGAADGAGAGAAPAPAAPSP